MSEQTMSQLTGHDHETYARQAIVNMATAFRKASRKLARRNILLVGGTCLASALTVSTAPDLTLPITTLGGAATLITARRQQKMMRAAYAQTMEAVPPAAYGFVKKEMLKIEKVFNEGRLDFSMDDLDLQKHKFKYAGTAVMALITPPLAPAYYMILLSADETKRAMLTDIAARETIARNTPKP